MLLAKLWARFRRWLHLMGQITVLPVQLLMGPNPLVHQAVDTWEEAHFDTPNRFGLRSATHLLELSCTCGKVFWSIRDHERGPHD